MKVFDAVVESGDKGRGVGGDVKRRVREKGRARKLDPLRTSSFLTQSRC